MSTTAPASMAFDALLFDMDGTLIDSMPLHDRAWQHWHAELGLSFDENGFFAATAGRTNAEIMRDLFPSLAGTDVDALAERKEAIYREIAARELEWIVGAQAVLAQARAQGLKVAVCTASPRVNIAAVDARLRLLGEVDTVTCPDDGLRGKPHPDIFLEAARRLGAEPARCLVFEDAPLGIEAARRGGMSAVALTTTLPASAFADFDNVLHCIPHFDGYALPTAPRARDA